MKPEYKEGDYVVYDKIFPEYMIHHRIEMNSIEAEKILDEVITKYSETEKTVRVTLALRYALEAVKSIRWDMEHPVFKNKDMDKDLALIFSAELLGMQTCAKTPPEVMEKYYEKGLTPYDIADKWWLEYASEMKRRDEEVY